MEMKMLLEDEDDHTFRLLEIIETVCNTNPIAVSGQQQAPVPGQQRPTPLENALRQAINDRSFVDSDGDVHECPGLTPEEIEGVIADTRSRPVQQAHLNEEKRSS